MPYLLTNDNSASSKRTQLKEATITIGRHPDCEIVLDENSVSRRHAAISFVDGHYYAEDLNSRNGTLVNGSEIQGKIRLFDGAEVRICDVVFHFLLEDGSQDRPLTTRVEAPPSHLRSSFFFTDELERQSSSTIMGQIDLPSGDTLRDTTGDLKEKLQAISAITEALSSAWDREQILKRVLETLFELFGESDRGFVAMVNETGEIAPHLMETRRPGDAERVRISRTIIRSVLQTKTAILSTDAANDERFDLSQSIVDFRIRSLMCAPLVDSAGNAVGAIQLDTLRSTVAFDKDDLEVLATVAMQASLALQKLELFRRVEENRQLEQDLRLAQEVQLRFLPQAEPQVFGYDFYSWYRPASHVGGDYYDYFRLNEQTWVIVVADVVGHGIAAALLMAKIAADTRFACALNPEPVAALEQINRSLNGLNMDRFVTLLLLYLDTAKHEVTLANAGHLPPLLRLPKGGSRWLSQAARGLPLGISESARYASETLTLQPGEVILLFTDGVNEALNALGDQFTLERVASEAELSPNPTPEAIGKAVWQAAKAHQSGAPQNDDVCVVAFGRV
jgi:serine phosphatase RsbU (regulator of sigma subunit)/pSer/pThr/pTyr-binding forkhead associated (FHA) protein